MILRRWLRFRVSLGALAGAFTLVCFVLGVYTTEIREQFRLWEAQLLGKPHIAVQMPTAKQLQLEELEELNRLLGLEIRMMRAERTPAEKRRPRFVPQGFTTRYMADLQEPPISESAPTVP